MLFLWHSKPKSSLAWNTKVRNKFNVIILGAGAAGIGAARELTAQGVNSILILEGK